MKYLKLFENVDNSERIELMTEVLLKLASIVSNEISGSNVHPSEDFDLITLYTLAIGEDKLLLIINKMLDERINRESDASIHKYDKGDFYINIKTSEITNKWSRGLFLSFYDMYNLLRESKKLNSQFTTWNDVKKLERG